MICTGSDSSDYMVTCPNNSPRSSHVFERGRIFYNNNNNNMTAHFINESSQF